MGLSNPIRGVLTESTNDVLHYDAAYENYAVDCAEHTITRHCRDGSTQECKVCELHLTEQYMGGSRGVRGAVETNSECPPCPDDREIRASIEPLDRVLRDRDFLRDVDPGLTFYRRRQDCEAARRAESSQ